MYYNKVEICGVDTSSLPKLSHDYMRQLLVRAHAGDKEARHQRCAEDIAKDLLADSPLFLPSSHDPAEKQQAQQRSDQQHSGGQCQEIGCGQHIEFPDLPKELTLCQQQQCQHKAG